MTVDQNIAFGRSPSLTFFPTGSSTDISLINFNQSRSKSLIREVFKLNPFLGAKFFNAKIAYFLIRYRRKCQLFEYFKLIDLICLKLLSRGRI